MDVNADPRRSQHVFSRTVSKSPRTVKREQSPFAAVRKERPSASAGSAVFLPRSVVRVWILPAWIVRCFCRLTCAKSTAWVRELVASVHHVFASVRSSFRTRFRLPFEPESDSLSNLVKPEIDWVHPGGLLLLQGR